MKTVAFYSYKGGVGRSLALAYTAKYLAECNFSVCIVDFDLEAPGIIHKFVPNELIPELDHSKLGLVDYIHTCFHEKPPKTVSEYFYTCLQTKFSFIKLMSAGRGLDGKYWSKLGRLDWLELFTGERNEGLFIFELLKHQIKTELKPDFLLLDSRAGVTILSKVCCSIIPDATIMFAANSVENFHGTRLMYRHIWSATEYKPSEKATDIHCVLTRIPDDDDSAKKAIVQKLVEKIGDSQLKPSDITVIHHDKAVAYNEHILLEGETDTKLESSIKGNYYSLITKIVDAETLEAKRKIIASDPKYKFIEYDMREFAENLINGLRGQESIDDFIEGITIKVEDEPASCKNLYTLAVCKRYQDKPIDAVTYLNKALSLGVEDNKLQVDIHYLRGLIFLYDLGNYGEAEKNLKVVGEFDEEYCLYFRYHFATCLLCIDAFDEAMSYANMYVVANTADYRVYLLKAIAIYEKLRRKKKLNRADSNAEINEALLYCHEAIKQNPSKWYSYYNRGLIYRNSNANDTEKALEDFNKAIELNPAYDKAYYNRGLIYEELGDIEKAQDDFRTVAELNFEYDYTR